MFNTLKSKLLSLNFKLNINWISRMILTGELDRYKGYTIKALDDNDIKQMSVEEFEASLKESLEDWQTKKYRVSWFKIGLKFTHVIPVLAKFGYVFHHSKTQYVVMNKWLCTTDPSNIPIYAFTNVGVGGLVIDDSDRVLVVKERHFYGNQQIWKFPGGYAEQGEDFGQTAIREVEEETGIKCEFQSVVTFRHIHKFAFDCSDLYIVCHLKPIKNKSNQTDDGLQVKKCSFEIDECKWFAIDQIRPQLSKFNLYVLDKFLSNRADGLKIGLESIESIVKTIDHKTYSIHKQN